MTKVTFGKREIELKATDRFVLDVDGACTDPYITQDEFVAMCNDPETACVNLFNKYMNQYEFEGGVYGAWIVRNGVALDDSGRAIIYNSNEEQQFSKELFEETLAA